jgi:Zn-dependent protease
MMGWFITYSTYSSKHGDIMKYSYKILRIGGIDIEVHLLFLIFIFSILILDMVLGLLLIMLFVFVTIHELAHSAVARHYKLKVKRIVLLPIGGVALMDLKRISPKKEFVISLAGPLTNFVFVFVFYILLSFLGYSPTQILTMIESETIPSIPELVLIYGFYANLVLGVFNLFVPAFPLDGGRILRALLSWKFGFEEGTKISRDVSIVISSLMFVLGLFTGNIWLLIIAFFVGFGALSEYEITILNKVSKKVIPEILIRKEIPLCNEDPLKYALEHNTLIVFLDEKTYILVPEYLENRTVRKVRTFVSPRRDLLFKAFMEEREPVVFIKNKGYIFAEDYKKHLELLLSVSKIINKTG